MQFENLKLKFDLILKGARKTANNALEKAEDTAKIARMKLDIYRLQSEIDRNLLEIGKYMYENITNKEIPQIDEPDVTRLVEEINKHKDRITEIQTEIEGLRQ